MDDKTDAELFHNLLLSELSCENPTQQSPNWVSVANLKQLLKEANESINHDDTPERSHDSDDMLLSCHQIDSNAD